MHDTAKRSPFYISQNVHLFDGHSWVTRGSSDALPPSLSGRYVATLKQSARSLSCAKRAVVRHGNRLFVLGNPAVHEHVGEPIADKLVRERQVVHLAMRGARLL